MQIRKIISVFRHLNADSAPATGARSIPVHRKSLTVDSFDGAGAAADASASDSSKSVAETPA
jgi:hypothetical protein